jgi:hypothetical protein
MFAKYQVLQEQASSSNNVGQFGTSRQPINDIPDAKNDHNHDTVIHGWTDNATPCPVLQWAPLIRGWLYGMEMDL